MPAEKSKFIRYEEDGEVRYLSHNATNLNAVRALVGGNFDTVEGFGVKKADGSFDFTTDEPKEDTPASPLVVNGAGAESEEDLDQDADPDIGEAEADEDPDAD